MNGSNQRTFPALHRLAREGDVEQVRTFLSTLPPEQQTLNLSSSRDDNGELPSHLASRAGHGDVLQLLLPDNSHQDLINARSDKEGWSALHLSAAYNHTDIVQWLFDARRAELNIQDHGGNTPLHLAISRGHKDVVRCLVVSGALLSIPNLDGMLPISFCNDQPMFDAIFTNYIRSSDSFNKNRPSAQVLLPIDAANRTILHYAAEFATDLDAIVKLISETGPDQLCLRDYQGDTFLHVAAKSGNVHILHAIKNLGSAQISISRFIGHDEHDELHNPGLCALLHNHRDFLDELITMSHVKVTLGCIVKGLLAELMADCAIQDRLALFASSLPTYLALYAKKDSIFEFLLEKEVVSSSQWDDEHKRTCLHWAVVDKRTDIVKKLCKEVHLRPGIEDGDGKTALQHAFEQKNHEVMDILRAKPGFKDHEEKLYRDREVYVQCLNAILVGAALIASVTFAGWLQVPSDVFKALGLKIFWASNSMSFFLSVASMCVTITALLPTPSRYVGDIVNQLRIAIVIDASLFALSLAAVMFAFAAAGFAALRHSDIAVYEYTMRVTTAVGGSLCLLTGLSFVVQLSSCAPSLKSIIVTLLSLTRILPSSLSSCPWPVLFQRIVARVGDSSRFGYPNKLCHELKGLMDDDLISYHPDELRPVAGTSPCEPGDSSAIHYLLRKLDISGKEKFIESAVKSRKDEFSYRARKDHAISQIAGRFTIPNNAGI